MILGSTRASRVVCGALAANSLWQGKRECALNKSGFVRSVRRGAERCTRGRVRSPAVPLAIAILFAISSQGAEVIPPKPDRYFNDYAGVVSKSAALRFNEELAQFERETSDQVVVAVFPKMQSDSDIADYTQRVAQAWGVGQRERRNGFVFFFLVFVVALIVISAMIRPLGGYGYSSRRGGPIFFPVGGGGGGWSSGDGGGGGFSGGGGSFGGGGAGSTW